MIMTARVSFCYGGSLHRDLTSSPLTWRRQVSFLPAATYTERAKTNKKKSISKKKNNNNKGELVKNYKKTKEENNVVELEPERATLKHYLQQSKELIKSDDGGPPRWFSPLECGGSRLDNSPLLLFLPGIDGVGLGLMLHHQKLGEIFDIWCLNIPIMDRTPFSDLVKLVEQTIRSENCRSPNRPIYLVGESLGGCLALAVAACNPDIDLVLILANPATSYRRSPLQSLIPILELMPDQLYHSLPYALTLVTGDPLKSMMVNIVPGVPLQPPVSMLPQELTALSSPSSYLSVLVGILPRESLLWKLQMLISACAYANSRLHAVKAQTLILSSGKDQLLPSQEESDRLRHVLEKCEIRKFNDRGHFLFLEDDFEFLTVLKATCFYRRGRYRNYVSDYIPPTPSEFNQIVESYRWMEMATSPVLLSTLGNGEIVRGLAGIPSEGPVLFVGYHMLLGLELIPMVTHVFAERNILLRGIAHPMMFSKLKDGSLPDLSTFDAFRTMGAVPVSAANFYRLFSSKSHVLLYPGGIREAFHRKGEEYKLFWPEQSEFVRMAVKFGATIVPFGVVGEDDFVEVFYDYNDLIKIPYFKARIQELTSEVVQLRTDASGEVSNQDIHLPGIRPKIPGRFYFLFGKPIETKGRMQELKDKEKSHKLYLHVKSEVESCLAYLKEKREKDPFRNISSRLVFQATHGFTADVPTFEI